jgi:hypothetical protein
MMKFRWKWCSCDGPPWACCVGSNMWLEILLLVLLSCVVRIVGSEDAVAGDTSCSGPISVSEYNVLQEFYVATHGAGWYDSLGWTFENDPSTRALSLPCSLPWYGISCITASSGNCSLSQLKLDNNNLISFVTFITQ